MASSSTYFDETTAAAAGGVVTFNRPINKLILTVETATVTMSLDGGANFMVVAVGTHYFELYEYQIHFTGGAFSGFGISL